MARWELRPVWLVIARGQASSAFITDYAAVDRIIDHLKLRFNAEKPPPSRVFDQVVLMAAEEPAEYSL